MRAGRSTSSSSCRLDDARRAPPKTEPETGAQIRAHRRAHPGGQRHRDRLEQQVEHRERVVGDATMARRGVARGHPRHQQRWGTERQCGMRRVQRGHATVPERRARSHDSRTRPADRRVPAEHAQPVVQGAGGRDRLALSPERRAGGQVSGQQTALAQRAHDARMATGQRASLGLHVPEPAPRDCLRECPCDRRQLAMQGEHRDRAIARAARSCSSSTGSTVCWRLV